MAPSAPVPVISLRSSSSICHFSASFLAAGVILRLFFTSLTFFSFLGSGVLRSLTSTLPSGPEPLTLPMSMPLAEARALAAGEAFTFTSAFLMRSLMSFTVILPPVPDPMKSSASSRSASSHASCATWEAKRETGLTGLTGFFLSLAGRRPLPSRRAKAWAWSAHLADRSSSMMRVSWAAEVIICREMRGLRACCTPIWAPPLNLVENSNLQKMGVGPPGAPEARKLLKITKFRPPRNIGVHQHQVS